MIEIKVPATSANIGPGFDSMGLALGLYLTLEIHEAHEEWLIEHELGAGIPNDKDNMIIQTALSIEPNLASHRLVMRSDIPTARGLGSSSSAIAAGILLAEAISGNAKSLDERIQIATAIEGHPDNVAPALAGGLVIASFVDGHVYWLKRDFPEMAFIVDIPTYELKTSDSRNVLPKQLAFDEAVAASSIANVVASALASGDLKLASQLMEKDRFHEPYRSELVPNLTKVRQLLKSSKGYLATYLSGAGPTVLTMVEKSEAAAIADQLRTALPEDTIKVLDFETVGAKVVTNRV